MDDNDRLLLAELKQLHALSDSLPEVAVAEPSDETALKVFALGALVLGREMLLGVAAEIEAHPARGLNALRLARHLWEMEQELHYVADDPPDRLRQLGAREAMTRRWLPRGYKGLRRAQLDEAFAKRLREIEVEVTAREQELREREEGGEEVAASEWPSMPDRLPMAKALGRKKEYHAHYAPASWLAHPSLAAIQNMLSENEAGAYTATPSELARSLPGMAASLARMVFARLAKRAYAILGDEAMTGRFTEFMDSRGIEESGVMEIDPNGG